MEFKRIAPNKSFSECGMYRVRKLRNEIYIAERLWSAGEKPWRLYAPWRFIGFAKNERQARNLCRRRSEKAETDAREILRDCGLTSLADEKRV